MRFLRFSVFLLFMASFCYAQNTTTLTGTVVDSDSQAWVNAAWTATIVIPGGGGQAHYKSGGLVPTLFSGTLNSSGAFQGGAVYGNPQAIVPTGIYWNVCIQSMTSAPYSCFASQSGGSTFNLGALASSRIIAPRMQAAKTNYAYNTTEILNVVNGTGYYNTSVIPATQWVYQNGYQQISGGGGATAPATVKLYGGNNTSNGIIAGLPQQVGPTLEDATLSSMFAVDTYPSLPSCTSGCPNDVFMGVGVAPSITQGSGFGGQSSVIIGHNAGHAITTAREDVLIGDGAGQALTGNSGGSSAEDTVINCIGSLACSSLLSSGSSNPMDDVFFGQKAGANMTNAGEVVEIGNHVANLLASSNDSVHIGYNAGTNSIAGSLSQGDTIIGDNAGTSSFPSSYQSQYNTAIGYFALNNIGTGASGGTQGNYNTVYGAQSGGALSTAYQTTCIGYDACYFGGSSNNTGHLNTCIGYAACQSITTGYDNTAISGSTPAGNLTTGIQNFIASDLANITTGSDNVCIGVAACQFEGGGEQNLVAVGFGAQLTAGTNYGAEIGSGTCPSVYQSGCFFGERALQENYAPLATGSVLTWDGPTQYIADSGISRIGPGSLAIGNHTAGDFSGSIKIATQAANSNNNLAADTAYVDRAVGTHLASQTPTYTVGGSNTAACASAFTCTSIAGTVLFNVVGSPQAPGSIITVSWPTTISVGFTCQATQNGGAVWYGIGNTAPTSGTQFIVTNSVAIPASTAVDISYVCVAN